jgi:hypothetical protein
MLIPASAKQTRGTQAVMALSSVRPMALGVHKPKRSIFEAHPQGIELLCIRVPAFCCLGSCFGGRLDGLGALERSRFD